MVRPDLLLFTSYRAPPHSPHQCHESAAYAALSTPSMPPKSSSKQQQQPKIARPTKHEVEAVQRYLAQKPDFEKLIEEAKQSPKSSPAAKREETEYERKTREAVSALHKGKANASVTMPVHPKEEETSGSMPTIARPAFLRVCNAND